MEENPEFTRKENLNMNSALHSQVFKNEQIVSRVHKEESKKEIKYSFIEQKHRKQLDEVETELINNFGHHPDDLNEMFQTVGDKNSWEEYKKLHQDRIYLLKKLEEDENMLEINSKPKLN